MMKKLLFALLGIAVGIVVVVAAALAIGPRLIDLRPRVAAAVHDATGRDLRIDGDLSVALLPKIRIFASDVHLSNAPGATAPEMASIESVAFEGELWPLLRKRLVVDSLVVKRPTINLEVDKAGRPNWVFATAQGKPEQEPPQQPEAQDGSSLADIRVENLGIEQGQISYRDAGTGQAIDANDVTLAGAMPEPERPLTLKGHVRLNDEPVTADLIVDNVGKLQRSEQADVKLAFDTKHVTANFNGTAQRRPVPGLNGVFDLAIPSVGGLAAWLNAPLDSTQPDPGPLKVHALFESNGTKSLLKEATVTGTGLDAKASGSFDASGPTRKITAVVESGVLDLDRYLPPQARDKGLPHDTAGVPQGQAPSKEVPAGLSDRPFDLGALRELEADVKVSIAGVKAMGNEIGRIAFTTEAKSGVVVADLAELALYGGTVKGTTKIDGAGDQLGVETAVKVDRVTVDKLARQAPAGAPAVSGGVSAMLDAQARGKSPRALMDDLRGHLAVDLGGLNVSAIAAISQLKLDVDLPGADKAPSLKASVTYKGERVDTSATLAPLGKLASGERFPAKLGVDSKLVTLRYDGTLQQKPVAGIDGTFDVDVPSVGKLAAWVGRPLDPKQPDPGPIKLKALLATDGTKLTLKDAALTGKAIDATARASLDAGRKPLLFDAKIDVRQANIDAYLPPTEKRTPVSPAPRQQRQQQPATGWSTERFDLAALSRADGKLEATLAAIRYQGLEIINGKLGLELAGGVLKLVTERIAVDQGTIDSVTTLDASGVGVKLAHRVTVARIQARPLLKAFADSDRIGGTIDFQTQVTGSGVNQQQLISSLNGTGQFKLTKGAIYGINLVAALRKAGSLEFGNSQGEATEFGELGGSYTINSGVIENRDLLMSAPLLGMTGSGRVPMPTQTIDYVVEAKLGGNDALAGVPIPIKVTGTWSNPRYEPDWGGTLKTIANQPERLKNLPGDLGKAAKGLGSGLPGLGQTPAPSGQSAPPKPGGLPFSLPQGLLGK